jgi:hypothetical protein
MLMHRVVVVVDGQIPTCYDESCPHAGSCANHDTAGNFRTEDGLTPNLTKILGVWMCDQNPRLNNGARLVNGGCFEDLL